MREVLLEAPVRYWRCVKCMAVDKTQKHEPHTQMHNCSGLKGLSIPMIEVASPRDDPSPKRHRHVTEERGDFVGGKKMEPFRPITVSVRTERFDGSNDCTVFPGTAVVFMNQEDD